MLRFGKARTKLLRAKEAGRREATRTLAAGHEKALRETMRASERAALIVRASHERELERLQNAHERRIKKLQAEHEKEIRLIGRGCRRRERRTAALEDAALEKSRRWDRMIQDAAMFLARAGNVVQATSDRHRELLGSFARGAADADRIADLQSQLADLRSGADRSGG